MGYWRDEARPVIAAVIEEHGRDDTPELRRALREAYPFGERKRWPYKVWLTEIWNQMHPEAMATPARRAHLIVDAPGQLKMEYPT